MDDVNSLSSEEAKYFDTRGADAPAEPEKQPDLLDQVEKTSPEAEAEKQPETNKPEQKAPPEIEVVEDDDGEGEPDARKYVKVGVLRKEREQRKAMRSELEQTRQQMAHLRQQFEQTRNPPREIQPEEAGQIALERLQQIEAHSQEAQAKQNFINNWQRTAQAYLQEQPDFKEAYTHALGVRRGIYAMAGYSEAQQNQLLEGEEAAIVEKALIEGKNPAKVIYDIAKSLGYTAKAKESAKEPDVVKSAEKLAKIAEGMAKNKSASGGGASDAAPTLQEIADMDEAEFEKVAGDPKKWKALMGG